MVKPRDVKTLTFWYDIWLEEARNPVYSVEAEFHDYIMSPYLKIYKRMLHSVVLNKPELWKGYSKAEIWERAVKEAIAEEVASVDGVK